VIFRGRAPEATVWRRFRSGADGFTFFRRSDELYETHIVANAERVVDLFYALTEHLPPAIDFVLDDKRTTRAWIGEDIALPDARDAIARMKVPLATYGGVEIDAYSSEDQLTLTAQLELFAYARSDRWLYLLQGKGLEEYGAVADKTWRHRPWDRTAAPVLSEAAEAAAGRLSLRPVQA
jgi:hypothetical protein